MVSIVKKVLSSYLAAGSLTMENSTLGLPSSLRLTPNLSAGYELYIE
jgi:hypothetical protein